MPALPALPDLDEVFAYKTKKVVVIKDRFLGGLWTAGVIAIIAYFVVDRIILDQAHFKRERFRGVVETSLKAPRELTPASQLHYCEGGPGSSSKVLPCITGPDIWVQAPSTGNSELFVTTRLKDLQNGSKPRYSFVQDPERYTVGISFALQAPELQEKTGSQRYTRRIWDLQTSLVDLNGRAVSGAVRRISRFDVIELNSLLSAAGVSNVSSVRYKGTILLLMINCPMDRDGSVSHCTYKVQHLQNAQAKAYIAHSVGASNDWQVQERRGLKIVVLSAGEMGQFQWSAFMLAWVSSFGMLGMLKLIIDFVMARLMPMKQVYRLLKWEQSVDFSDYRHGEAHAVAQVNHLKAECERFARHKHEAEAKEPIASQVAAEAARPAADGRIDTHGQSVEVLVDSEADERCGEDSAQQVAIGRRVEDIEDVPARAGGRPKRSHPQQETRNAQTGGADEIAPVNAEHVHEITEVCLGRLMTEHQRLREELTSLTSARNTELEQMLREHISTEIANERDQLNQWAEQTLTKQFASDYSCYEEQFQARMEFRLTEFVSKTVAKSKSSLEQTLMDAQVDHFEKAKSSLKHDLSNELAKSIVEASGRLQKDLAGQLHNEVSSCIAGLRHQISTEIAALKEQQCRELRLELSRHQEPWKSSLSENVSEEALTRQLVNWQPQASALVVADASTFSAMLPEPESSNSAGCKAIEPASARHHGALAEAHPEYRRPSSDRGGLAPLPNPMDSQDLLRLKAELTSLKTELAKRTREDSERAAMPTAQDSPSPSGASSSRSSEVARGDNENAAIERSDWATNVAHDIW